MPVENTADTLGFDIFEHLNIPKNSPQAQFEQTTYPYKDKMKKAVYEAQKAKLQVELLKVQQWVEDTNQKIVILFEGRDAAGKGGTIKRFTEHLNPRTARVVALNKPTEREQSQWYYQRYIQHLPSAGEIVFFDRSWYNRAGVERVMGFSTPQEYLEFMRQTPDFERMITRSGIRLFKYWFSVTQEEQFRRFESREHDPLKHWKLSPIDRASLKKWDAYTEAKEAIEESFIKVQQAEENPWLWNSVGLAELNLFHYSDAEQSFAKALELAQGLSLDDWHGAYPGNNPEGYSDGLTQFKDGIAENIRRARVK